MKDHFSSSTKPQVSNLRLMVPFVLLLLCLLALIVSLSGLYRTSVLAEARVADLQASWQTTTQVEASGSRVAEIDRLMQGIARPVPEIQSAAWWSLAMGGLSLVFVVWFFWGVRSAAKTKRLAYRQFERNEAVALAKLLDEIAPLASGNLDVLATAKEGTPGALADAFNYAITELQRLARLQIYASRTLTDIASQTQNLESLRFNNAGERSELAHRSSNVLLGMSNVAGEVSVHASEVAAINGNVLESAHESTFNLQACAKSQTQGQASLQAITDLMQAIIGHVETIDSGTNQIEEIKGRVDLLTTNAALALSSKEAIDTGAAPAGVVTHLSLELSALVEDLNQANGAVSLATRSIHSDISESISILDQLSQAYGDQIKQVSTVADSIERLDSSNEKLRSHAGTIAGQAVSQGLLVSTLSKNIELINRGVDQETGATCDNTDCLAQLSGLANEMRQSLSHFNLPAPSVSEANVIGKNSSFSPLRRSAERAIVND